MKIAVIGAGGAGGFFGAKMIKAGFDVTLVARGKHFQAIQGDGLFVKSVEGDFLLPDVKVVNSISQLENPDLLILGLKTWQMVDVVRDLGNVIKDDTAVLPLQNGVTIVEELSEHIERKAILGGLCRIISKIEQPGTISHTGIIPEIVLGEMDGSISQRIVKIHEILFKSGIVSRISNDIKAEIWKKFILICVGGLLGQMRTTFGELRKNPGTRKQMNGLMQEVFLLSQKMEIKIESDYVEKTMAFIDTFPEDATFSLARDIWAKKPSELEYQNGAVVQLGLKLGIKTPINKFVYDSLVDDEP